MTQAEKINLINKIIEEHKKGDGCIDLERLHPIEDLGRND